MSQLGRVLGYAVAGTVCLAGLPAAGQVNNGSFETGSYTWNGQVAQSLFPGSTVMAGWTVVNGELAAIGPGNSFGIVAHQGNVSLDLAGYDDAPPYGGVTQNVATNAGARYRLSYWIGAFGVGTQSKVTATAGGTSNVGTGPVTVGNTGVTWTLATLDFLATSGVTAISLIGAQSSNGGNYIGLDDVSLQLTSLAGDANNDGRVDADDYALIDRGNAMHLSGWWNGDFSGDGTVNAADYQIIDAAYAQSHAPLLMVPEPALATVMAGAASVMARGRRRVTR